MHIEHVPFYESIYIYIYSVVIIIICHGYLLMAQIGLAVGDIAEVQRNAALKRIAMQVHFDYLTHLKPYISVCMTFA